MSSEVAALEAEVKEYKLQLETVALSLQNDPDSAELQSLKQELEEVIALTESAISELKPAPALATEKPVTSTKEKWSKENHPAYKAGYRPPEAEEEAPTQTTFSVNDTVLARWKSGDGGFYNARITSKTGSSANPVYTVLFKNYGTTETCYAKDIRPLSVEAKKRKADSISGSTTPVTIPSNTSVISAAPTVDPSLAQQAKREPSKVSDGPVRPAKIPRQVKAKNELEAGKAKWQDFAAKAKGKHGKKDSMFRTGEGVTARGESPDPIMLRDLLTLYSWFHRFRPSYAKGSYQVSCIPVTKEPLLTFIAGLVISTKKIASTSNADLALLPVLILVSYIWTKYPPYLSHS